MHEQRENPELDAAKRDLGYLLGILGIASGKTADNHAPCPICGDKTCLKFGPDKKYLGNWFWNCCKGCGGGDIVEALIKVRRLSYKEAFAQIRADFKGRVPRASPHDQYHQQRRAELGVPANSHHNGLNNGNGHTSPIQAPPAKPEPVLDAERAEKFVADSHDFLMRNYDAFMKKFKRGISREVCEKYRLGFIEFGKVPLHPVLPPTDVPAAWVIPITNSEHMLKGVKIHFEERPVWRNAVCPKLLWAAFGTKPAYFKGTDEDGREVKVTPVHAYYSMWPHPETLMSRSLDDFSLDAEFWIQRIPESLKPEWNDIVEAQKLKLAYELGKMETDLSESELWTSWLRAFEEIKQKIFKAVLKTEEKKASNNDNEVDWSQYIFICPGELKALACESAGLMATSTTGGESWMPGPEILTRFAGQRICLVGDDDPPKKNISKTDGSVIKIFNTGKEWIDKWMKALYLHGAAHVVAKYGGKREKE